MQGSIDRLVISGLSEFSVDRLQVDETGMQFDLSFAKLISAGRYTNNIDGLLIHFFPIGGRSGDFR